MNYGECEIRSPLVSSSLDPTYDIITYNYCFYSSHEISKKTINRILDVYNDDSLFEHPEPQFHLIGEWEKPTPPPLSSIDICNYYGGVGEFCDEWCETTVEYAFSTYSGSSFDGLSYDDSKYRPLFHVYFTTWNCKCYRDPYTWE